MGTVIVPLDGGLNDTGRKSSQDLQGSVRVSLNYERGIDEGYTSVGGFSRWDGRYGGFDTANGFVIRGNDPSSTPWTVGEVVTVNYDDANAVSHDASMIITEILSTVDLGGSYTVTAVAVFTSPQSLPVSDYPVNYWNSISSITTTIGEPYEAGTRVTSMPYSTLRSLITSLPMSSIGKTAGAHFFRNRLYTISDYACIRINNVSNLSIKEGAVLTNVTPNPDVTLGTVVGFTVSSGNASAGTAVVDIVIRGYGGTAPASGDDIWVQGVAAKLGDFDSFQQSPRAGLFYADYNGSGGWNEVNAGRRFRYKVDSSCTGAAFTAYSKNGFATDVNPASGASNATYAPASITAGAGWYTSSSPGNPALVGDINASGGDASYHGLSTAGPVVTDELKVYFGTSVAASLPTGATVVGVELTIRRANGAGAGVIVDDTVRLIGLSGPPGRDMADSNPTSGLWPVAAAYAPKTYGGALNTWDHTIRTEDVLASTFGVLIRAKTTSGLANTAYIDQVSLKLYYKEQTQDIYIYDQTNLTDVEQVKVIHYTIDQGTFNAKNAEGTLVVTDMASIYARATQIGIGFQLRTAAAGGGALLGYYNSVDQPINLPSSDILATADTRWTFTTCNPWAVENSDMMIACSGVEEAYAFDGDYLLPIATGLKPVEEIPRHVAYFQNQLFLGYASGIVQGSDVGQILQFNGGEAGATENGLGDRVTGLLALKGQALAVFTERTIRAIYADGAGVQDVKIISDSSGAIEYTVVDMGIPMFADYRGIATLSAVQEYGDFQRGRLTNKVTRLMLSRLQFETVNQTTDKRPIAALAIRNKNQYRLFYKDGYFTTLTLAGDDINPQTMLCRYFISGSNSDSTAVRVLALATGVTTDGRDVAFFTTDNQSTMWKYVYQIDAGRSFDSGAIVAYVSLNPIWGDSLSVLKRWDRMSVYGRAYGSASLTASFASAFTAPSSYSRTFTLGSGTASTDPDDVMATVEVGQDARGLMVRFDSSSSTTLPHTLQLLDLTTVETQEKKR